MNLVGGVHGVEVVEVGGGNVDVIEARDGRADSDLHSDSDSFLIPARPDTQHSP